MAGDNKKVTLEINNLYKYITYIQKHGLDILITVIIIIIFISFIIYFSVLNNLKRLRANWDKEKCNPINFPFIHIINPNPNKTPSEQIKETLNFCVVNSIKNSTNNTFKNLFNQLNLFTNLQVTFLTFINKIIKVFNILMDIIVEIISRILSFARRIKIIFSRILITIENIFNTIIGVLITKLYMFLNIFNIFIAYVANIGTIGSVLLIPPVIGIITLLIFLISVLKQIILILFPGLGIWFISPIVAPIIGALKIQTAALAAKLFVVVILLTFLIIIISLLNIISQYAVKAMNTTPQYE